MKKFISLMILILVAFLMVGCELNPVEEEDVDLVASQYLTEVGIKYAGSDSASAVTDNITLGSLEKENVKVAWTSSDESIISKEGVVNRGESDETVTLTVAVTYKSATYTKDFNILVKAKEQEKEDEKVLVTYIRISGDKELNIGETYQLTASVSPSDAENTAVSWSSSDDHIAMVDADGKVTAVATGEATITATAKDEGGVKGTYKVTVLEPEEADPITISQALALNKDDNAKIKGTVIASYAQGFLVYDGTGIILVYLGSKVQFTQKVGDYVIVEGAITKYKDRSQFTSTCTITECETGTDYVINPTVLDVNQTIANITNFEFGKLVTVECTISSTSASYINATLEGSSEYGICVQYPFDATKYEVGKTYTITGYTLYTSAYKNVTSLYLMADSFSEKITNYFSVLTGVADENGQLSYNDATAITITKFGFSGIYDAIQSDHVWFLTNDQIKAENEENYAAYEKFAFKQYGTFLVLTKYVSSSEQVAIQDIDADYVLMVTKDNENLEALKALTIGSVLTIDVTKAEVGDVAINASIASFKGEEKQLVEGESVKYEAQEKENYAFLGWCNVLTGEYVTEVTSDAIVVPMWKKMVFEATPETLKAVLEEAPEGATINLAPGIYMEEYTINKGVKLINPLVSNPIYNSEDYLNEDKAVGFLNKIILNANNITLENLTFIRHTRIGWYGTTEIENFKFLSNYVNVATDEEVEWLDNYYGVGTTDEEELWKNYPGFITLAGLKTSAINTVIDNNYFDTVYGTAVYICQAQGLEVTNNKFANIELDAIRIDSENSNGQFTYADNVFETVQAIAIYQRGFARFNDTTIDVKSNMFKNCGYGEYTVRYTALGAFSTYKRTNYNNVTLNFNYNIFENNNSNLAVRGYVGNVATYTDSALTFDLNVNYNAFITSSEALIQQNYFKDDSEATNVKIGKFNNNYYGSLYLTKFDITDANFDNVLEKDTTTYETIKELVKALPAGASLPNYTIVQNIELSEDDEDAIKEYKPTLFVKGGLDTDNNYTIDGTLYKSNVTIFASLADALAVAQDNDVIYVFAGKVTGDATVQANNITIVGAKSYDLIHSDTYTVSEADSVLALNITASNVNDFKLFNVVLSGSINLDTVENTRISSVYATTGTISLVGTNKNFNVDHYYYAGGSTRVIYVKSGSMENFTVDTLVCMDSAIVGFTEQGKWSNGICDTIRFGEATAAKVGAGNVTIKNCYFRAGQSGFMDRFPNADRYTLTNNYFYQVPAAVYFRSATISKEMHYTIQYNIFEKCGNSISDWDVLAVTTGDATVANVNYNSFLDNFPYVGTATDYVIKIRSDKGTIDCINNYFNKEADKEMNLNATGLTYVGTEGYYLVEGDYQVNQVALSHNVAVVYGINGYNENDYKELNRGSEESPMTASQAIAYIKCLEVGKLNTLDYGYVKGVVTAVTYNSKYDSYTATIAGDNDENLTIYSGNLGEGVKAIQVGDTVTVKGYFELYTNSATVQYEFAGSTGYDYPIYIANEKAKFAVSVSEDSSDKAEVSIDGDATKENGSTFTFTVSLKEAYATTHKIVSVSVNGVAIEEADGVYTATVDGATTILVTVGEKGDAEVYTINYDIEEVLTSNEIKKGTSYGTAKSLTTTDGRFTFAAAGGTNTGKAYGTYANNAWSSGTTWRFYKTDKPSGQLTISVASGKDITITSIEINYTQNSKSTFVIGTTTVLPNVAYKCNGKTFTFTASVASRCDIKDIKITFEEAISK